MSNILAKILFGVAGLPLIITILSCRECNLNQSFSGDKAFVHVEKIVNIGPRVPGSQGSATTQRYIIEEIKAKGLEAVRQEFSASTPVGNVSMVNVIGKLGRDLEVKNDSRIIVLGTHYDTKIVEGVPGFAGANDGTSGVGVLLELARILKDLPVKNSVWFVFFDGEESYEEKSPDDWFYGSKYFVSKFTESGKAHAVKYMILLDMVGDSDFQINRDTNSSAVLTDKVKTIAAKLGYGRHFFGFPMRVSDDHIPFIQAGIPSIDLIDFTYGGSSTPGYYWHTAEDTIDKVSSSALKMTGDVVLNLVLELDGEI